jgi:hypothetical protein
MKQEEVCVSIVLYLAYCMSMFDFVCFCMCGANAWTGLCGPDGAPWLHVGADGTARCMAWRG